MARRPKSPLRRRSGINFVNLSFDDVPPCHSRVTSARQQTRESVTDFDQYADKSSPSDVRINGHGAQQKICSECNPSTRNVRQYGVNNYVSNHSTRCRSVPVKDFRSHSSDSSTIRYRPNSSHQYLSPEALKDSTIQDANVHLGNPTRTSLLRTKLRRKSAPNSAHLRRYSEIRDVVKTVSCDYEASTRMEISYGTGDDVSAYLPLPNYGSVSDMLSLLASKERHSLHGFLTGGRYTRSNYAVHTCRTSSSKSSVNSRQRISHSSSSSNHDDTLTSTSTLASTPDVSVDWCIDDDVDSLAILPDLRSSCTQITKGPELRAGRAHSALRRSFPGGTADKILCSINRVNISFPCSNEDNSVGRPVTAKSSSVSARQKRVAWASDCRPTPMSSVDDDDDSIIADIPSNDANNICDSQRNDTADLKPKVDSDTLHPATYSEDLHEQRSDEMFSVPAPARKPKVSFFTETDGDVEDVEMSNFFSSEPDNSDNRN